MKYYYVTFLDDSYDSWLVELPTSSCIPMPSQDKDLDYTREFIVTEEFKDLTEEFNCVVVPIENFVDLIRQSI